jgi:micrococcal nuclease
LKRRLNGYATHVRLRAFAALAVGAVVAAATPADASLPAPSSFRLRATATGVLTSEVLAVRLASGKRERVRLIGIDAPARGECFGLAAERGLRAFAAGKRVTLTSDPSQRRRDGRGRLLAYVLVRKNVDLGGTLVGGGFARVAVGAGAFRKRPTYRVLQSAARAQRIGLWRSCG